MQVTAIVPIDKKRSKVLLDEDFAFVLYRGELKHYKIEEGHELSEETYRLIMDEVLKKRARERALYLLKDSDKTEEQIRKKLKEGYYPEEAIDSAVDFLKEYRYIDDAEYGRKYIRSYADKRSRKRIRADLIEKGLERDLIDQLFEEEDVSEDEQIRAFLQKKGYEYGVTSAADASKMKASLARKGYSYDAIEHAMNNPTYS